MIELLLLSSLVGFAGHATHYLFDLWQKRSAIGWIRMARYAVGIMILIPVTAKIFEYLYREGMNERDAKDTAVIAVVTSSVGIASGVGAGYALDSILDGLVDLNNGDD